MSSKSDENAMAEGVEENSQDDGPEELTFEQQKQRARQARQQTKTFEFEWSDGAISRYEYRELTEDEQEELRQAHTRTHRGRSGDVETEIDRKDLHIGLIKKGVVEGPQGFTATDRAIEESTTPSMRTQLAEAIESFSTMDEVERAKFH